MSVRRAALDVRPGCAASCAASGPFQIHFTAHKYRVLLCSPAVRRAASGFQCAQFLPTRRCSSRHGISKDWTVLSSCNVFFVVQPFRMSTTVFFRLLPLSAFLGGIYPTPDLDRALASNWDVIAKVCFFQKPSSDLSV